MPDRNLETCRAILDAQLEAATLAALQCETANELEPAAQWHALAAFYRGTEMCLKTPPLDLDALGVQLNMTAEEACYRWASEAPTPGEILAAHTAESDFAAVWYERLADQNADPRWEVLATFHRAVEACLRAGVDLDALITHLSAIDESAAKELGLKPMTMQERYKIW